MLGHDMPDQAVPRVSKHFGEASTGRCDLHPWVDQEALDGTTLEGNRGLVTASRLDTASAHGWINDLGLRTGIAGHAG